MFQIQILIVEEETARVTMVDISTWSDAKVTETEKGFGEVLAKEIQEHLDSSLVKVSEEEGN